MKHYKHPITSELFAYESDGSQDEFIAPGLVEITQAEADALRYQPPAIPQSVTRRQARQALLLAGKLNLVQPAIDAIPDATQRAMMQIEWGDSQEFERNRPSLIAIGGAIGLDAAGIDALFVQAAAL